MLKQYSTDVLYETKPARVPRKIKLQRNHRPTFKKRRTMKQQNRKQMWLQTELGSIIEKIGILKHCMHDVYSLPPALENQYQEQRQ
jgi:hypothetical protein